MSATPGYTAGMNSRLLPHIRVALLATLISPACTTDKGTGSEETGDSSTGGSDTSSGGDITATGGVLTSTNGSTSEQSTGATTSGTSTTDASTSTGSTGDLSATGTTGEPEISCVDEPLYFPTFDRSCVAVEDCSVVYHQVDCCGNMQAWGINNDSAKAFTEIEAVCAAQYPPCGCRSEPPVADDGNSADPASIKVACMDGECKTYVP